MKDLMRIFWNLVKVIVALVIAIPVAIILLGTTLGLLGALVGLAVLALKLAFFGVVAVGLYKLGKRLFRSSRPEPVPVPASLPSSDAYYDAAMRELDRELEGLPPRR